MFQSNYPLDLEGFHAILTVPRCTDGIPSEDPNDLESNPCFVSKMMAVVMHAYTHRSTTILSLTLRRCHLQKKLCASLEHAQNIFHSVSPSCAPMPRFFSYKRQRRLRRLQQQEATRKIPKEESPEADGHGKTTKDTSNDPPKQYKKPWWKYITIWPDPHGYDPHWENRWRIPWPKSYQQLRLALSEAVKEYRSTFEGWIFEERPESKQNQDTDTDTDNEARDAILDVVHKQRKQIEKNLEKNVNTLKEEGKKFQKFTGIYSLADLKQWAAEQLQLATECVKEFMVGYRHGRDEEVDKMLNQYFQGMWEDVKQSQEPSKKRTRKPKRRIRTAD